MDPSVVEIIGPVVALVSMGTIVLIGIKMRYSHLQRMRLGGSSQEDIDRVVDAVDHMRGEVRLMREEVLSLNERVEFTERLLERPRGAEAKRDTRQ